MTQKLFEPVHECKCKGKLTIDSDTYDVNFIFRQLQNGRITGEIQIHGMRFGTAYDLMKSIKEFTLTGKDEAGDTIVVNSCYLTGVTSNDKISARFNASEAIRKPERLEDSPRNELVVVFGLLNIDETFRVTVDTRLGKLFLRHIKGYKEYLPIIHSQGVSAITAAAQVHIKTPDSELSFKDILSEAIDVVEGFLRITSLAQTCYHDWCSVGIYEKLKDSENYGLVLYKMIRPKLKPPKYRGLTNPAHSSRFIESAYKGYRGREQELRDSYDFEIALEWYLESNIASVLESAYLMSCTCLELLIDRYRTSTETEYILDSELFRQEVYPTLKKATREYLKKLKSSPKQRKEIYSKLKGLNRWSFRAGIEALLDHLGVKYDDLFNDLGIIVKIRNKITHEGKFSDVRKLADVRNKLYVLLTRIFLCILNYDDEYYDWIRGNWVHINEVRRTPVAKTGPATVTKA